MKESTALKTFFEWIQAFVIAFVAALLINVFVFELYTITGSSMVPNFHDGDKILAVKLHYLFKSEPDYGDVIILDSRVERLRTLKDEFLDTALVSKLLGRQNNAIYIKRVIGKAGDTIEVKDGVTYRNGQPLTEKYINEEMTTDFPLITVPKGTVFVMGDNRNASEDSRAIGPVPLQNVRGKVIFRLWPNFTHIKSYK